MKAFLGIEFVVGINKLRFFKGYWSIDKCIENEKIENVMTKARFQSI